jgi:hypothetical protein
MSLSRLHLVSVSLYSMFSLQYRRYTLQSVPFVLPPFSLHFRRQLSTFIISPSSMYPRTPPPSTFNTSRFPFGAPSVSIHPSQCRLLCPCVAHIRRMRDRPRHFVCFKFLFVFSPSRRFGRLLSAIVQHVRRICVVNAILFCSFTGSRSR